MAIKRNSCRVSERKRMRIMADQGYSIPQISNAVSVRENIVTQVIDGSWDALEAQGRVQQKANDEARKGKARTEKQEDAAVVATAVVAAIKANEPELSPQQRAANTRKANREAAKLEQEEAEAEAAQTGEAPGAAA